MFPTTIREPRARGQIRLVGDNHPPTQFQEDTLFYNFPLALHPACSCGFTERLKPWSQQFRDDLASVAEVPPALPRLADDFVAHGYDLRRLIRVIAATEAFRRDSAGAGAADVTEAQEEAWAAFPLTRLRPEQVTAMLVTSPAPMVPVPF